MIVVSILDAAPLSLRFTFSVIFQDSQPYGTVDITLRPLRMKSPVQTREQQGGEDVDAEFLEKSSK